MISSVSAVSFKANPQTQSAQDRINSPGKFTKPETAAPAQAPKKKHRFLKALAGIVAAAIVVGGAALLGFKKGKLNVLDAEALKNAGFMEKAGHYFGKLGNWVDSNIWQKIPGVAKRAAQATRQTADSADAVVAEVVK